MQQIQHQLLLEQMDHVRKIRSALGLLRVESKVLRKRLGAEGAARSGLAESWKAIEGRIDTERRNVADKSVLVLGGAEQRSVERKPAAEAFVWVTWVDEGLRSLLDQVSHLRRAMAFEDPVEKITEGLDALDRQTEKLDRALEGLGRELAAELDEKLRLAYDRPE
jgi:hypothetical protein